jgi:hypothetical protein
VLDFWESLRILFLSAYWMTKHPEAEHVRLLSIYSARGNTKIKTHSQYS